MLHRLKQFLPNLIGIAAYVWLICCFFRTWRDPLSFDGGQWITFGVKLLFLEMILVVSGAIYSLVTDPSSNLTLNGELLSDERKREFQSGAGPWLITGIFILIGFGFGIVTGMMNVSTLQILVATMASRLIGVYRGSESARAAQRLRFMVGAALYLVVTCLVVNLPCPVGGITQDVLALVKYNSVVAHPERALWALMVYFGLLTLLELLLPFFQKPQTSRADSSSEQNGN